MVFGQTVLNGYLLPLLGLQFGLAAFELGSGDLAHFTFLVVFFSGGRRRLLICRGLDFLFVTATLTKKIIRMGKFSSQIEGGHLADVLIDLFFFIEEHHAHYFSQHFHQFGLC